MTILFLSLTAIAMFAIAKMYFKLRKQKAYIKELENAVYELDIDYALAVDDLMCYKDKYDRDRDYNGRFIRSLQ